MGSLGLLNPRNQGIRAGTHKGMMKKAKLAASAMLLSVLATPAVAQVAASGFMFLQAVEQRDGNRVSELLGSQGSAVLNYRGDDGTGALHIVAKRRDAEWLRFLLSKGADANIQTRAGDTPLHIAARSGWIDGIDLLLVVRARVDPINRAGETPLIVAVQQKQAGAVRRFLEAGANPDRTDNASGRSARDYAKLDTRSTEILRLIEQVKSKKPAAVAGPKL